MDELGMMNRRFSLGARGYNQDEVDAFLAGVAERTNRPGADPAREVSRISLASFPVVTLGYSRSEVNRYLAELRETLERRVERRAAGTAAAAEEPEAGAVEEPAAEAADVEMPEPEAPEPEASEPEPSEPDDVVRADGGVSSPWAYRSRAAAAAESESASSPATRDDERAALFATALDLRIEGAVAMTSDELRAAIADVRGVQDEAPGEDAQADLESGESTQAILAALRDVRTAVDALEARVLGDLATAATEQQPIAEAEDEPTVAPDSNDAPAMDEPAAMDEEPAAVPPEPIRHVPASSVDEPRPGIVSLTRDIIRLARGGTAGGR